MINNINKTKIALVILFSPIFINTFLNFFKSNILKINFSFIVNILSTLLLFLFLYTVGQLIRNIFNLRSLSISIVSYLTSFFILDNFIIIFTQNISLKNTFLLVNLFWFITFLIYSKKFNKIRIYFFYILLSYALLYFFNNYFFTQLISNSNIVGDVSDMWFPWLEQIYNNNYYYLILNSREGYGLFSTYIQSVLLNTAFYNQNFYFFPSIVYINYLFIGLFIYELKSSKFSKLINFLLLSCLLINNKWLSFLLVTSLMSEGIISYVFSVFVFEIYQIYKSNTIKSSDYVLIFIIGFFYLSKFLTNIIVVILIILFLLTKNKKMFAGIGLSGIFTSEILLGNTISIASENEYLKGVNFYELLLDILMLRNLEIINLRDITQHYLSDRPLSYYIFINLFLLIMCFIKFKNTELNFILLCLLITFVNTVGVFLIYLTIWANIETESSYRYFLNIFIFQISCFIYSHDLLTNDRKTE